MTAPAAEPRTVTMADVDALFRRRAWLTADGQRAMLTRQELLGLLSDTWQDGYDRGRSDEYSDVEPSREQSNPFA